MKILQIMPLNIQMVPMIKVEDYEEPLPSKKMPIVGMALIEDEGTTKLSLIMVNNDGGIYLSDSEMVNVFYLEGVKII